MSRYVLMLLMRQRTTKHGNVRRSCIVISVSRTSSSILITAPASSSTGIFLELNANSSLGSLVVSYGVVPRLLFMLYSFHTCILGHLAFPICLVTALSHEATLSA